MKKEKQNAYNDYMEMIKKSWTFDKLTETEKEKLRDVLFSVRAENAIKGNYNQRICILEAIYFSFLKALGYEPIGWRENGENYPKF